jgi:hypothetical protein
MDRNEIRGKTFWVALLDGEACNSFPTRKDAVIWLKNILKQSLKDFDKQDKSDEYDYDITLRKLEIKLIKKRETYLGL